MKTNLLRSLLMGATEDETILEVIFIYMVRVFSDLDDSNFRDLADRMMAARKKKNESREALPLNYENLANQLAENGAMLRTLFDVIAEIQAHLRGFDKQDVLQDMRDTEQFHWEQRLRQLSEVWPEQLTDLHDDSQN